jgi:hypothetical protein
MLSTYIQIIIQNLTTYTMYTVNVQAASLSVINPRRILLGLHSASRKVSITMDGGMWKCRRAWCYESWMLSCACISVHKRNINFNFLFDCRCNIFLLLPWGSLPYGFHDFSLINERFLDVSRANKIRMRVKENYCTLFLCVLRNDVGDLGNKSNVMCLKHKQHQLPLSCWKR